MAVMSITDVPYNKHSSKEIIKARKKNSKYKIILLLVKNVYRSITIMIWNKSLNIKIENNKHINYDYIGI